MSPRVAVGWALAIALLAAAAACTAVSIAAAAASGALRSSAIPPGGTSSPGARWSAPARPRGCSAADSAQEAPRVVFPSSAPTVGSGPGALLWDAPRGCAAAESAAPPGEVVAARLADDAVADNARRLAAGAGLTALAAAAGSAAGQVVAVGPSANGTAAVEEVVGDARGKLRPLGGPAAPAAAFSAYLGDVALASPVRTRGGWGIAVRTQRHYGEALGAARVVPVGRHPIAALAVTLDFRAEALLVWVSGGAVYACELPQSGPAQPAHRLAELQAGSPPPELGALLSDDGHAIVAWRAQSAARGGRGGRGRATTTIELSISARSGFPFGAPRTLERFPDPGGFVPPAGSLRLIRLSSEAVMLAWTGVRDGRYAVCASPVSLRRGAWAPVTISGSPGEEAILSDIATGPDAEAVAVWRAAPRLPGRARGGVGGDSWAIAAARGHYAGRGEVFFDAPEPVAPAAAVGPPAVAIDPASGRALAAWVSLAGTPHIEYAASAAAAALVAHRTRAGASGSFPTAAVVGAAFALVAAATVIALAVGARRAPRARARGW